MAKAKTVGTSGKGAKITFTTNNRGRTTIGKNPCAIKFSTMNKHKRAGYKAYRGQGR